MLLNKNIKNRINLVLNEEYSNKKILFEKGLGSKIFSGRKKFTDLSFGAGSLLLGHNSNIYKYAIKSLLKKNISMLASPNIQADNFSKLLKKIFPKYSKFIYCNSGTEAIIKSLRICKAITKKDLIIAVTGSWHGSVDKLLFSIDKKLKPVDLSGCLSSVDRKNIKFIPYNDIKSSKKILERYKKRASCIIIEPIQGCLPLASSKKYLKFLCKFSKKNKIVLIFDEMITGLRIDCKSVQSYFNLKPDISTFGKCLGGGMPIGIIAISRKIEKLISKNKKKVFFGGTFSGNSISSYVGMITTKYIIQNKYKIFSDLEKKSLFFQTTLNKFIKKNNIDAFVYRFKSILRLVFSSQKVLNRMERDFLESKKNKGINKLKSFLFKSGIYYPPSGIIFMSTSISNSDLKYLTNSFSMGIKKFIK